MVDFTIKLIIMMFFSFKKNNNNNDVLGIKRVDLFYTCYMGMKRPFPSEKKNKKSKKMFFSIKKQA
jgi:hypothetical protein